MHPLETPLIRKPRLRRCRTPSTVMSVHQSGRLAAKTKASNPTIQAQNVLKQGIANMAQSPEPTALDSNQGNLHCAVVALQTEAL